MYDLIRTAIQVGQCNPDVTPESLFPRLRRQAIATAFHEISDRMSETLVAGFRQVRFVAIALDAGSIKRRSFLTILLANALIEKKPFVLRIIRNFPGKFDDYSDAFESALGLIRDFGLILSGIVSDNLKVQTSVVSHLSKRSPLRQQHDLKGIRFFPCACHTFNLAFCDAQKSDGEVGSALKRMCDRVKEASKILCSRPIATMLSGHCPSFCPTRWTNLSEICCFLLHSRQEILTVMSQHMQTNRQFPPESAMAVVSAIYEDSPLFVALLAPYHDFVTMMESDSMSVGFVLPMLRKAVVDSYAHCDLLELGDGFPALMELCVGRRFAGPLLGPCKGRYGALYGLAELLTPAGRNSYRRLNLADSISVEAEGNLNPFFPEELTGYGPLLEWLRVSSQDRKDEFEIVIAKISEHYGPKHIALRLGDIRLGFRAILDPSEQSTSESSDSGYSDSDDFAEAIETDAEGTVEFSLTPRLILTRSDYEPSTVRDSATDSVTETNAEPQYVISEEEHDGQDEGEQYWQGEGDEEVDLPPLTNVFEDLSLEHMERELFLIGKDLTITPIEGLQKVWNTWITGTMPASSVRLFNGPPLAFWQDVANYPSFRPLAEIAQRLLVVPCSEASVERAIWHQRRVLCPGSFRMSCATEEARCRFLVSTE
jgi:hypothetical protein